MVMSRNEHWNLMLEPREEFEAKEDMEKSG